MKLGPLNQIHSIDHQCARSGGGTVTRALPFYRAVVDQLPEGLDGLVATGDLQGVADGALVGEKVAEELARLRPGKRLGILLAGDLYSAPEADRRGASGDVRSVWRAFAARHPFVTGVAGNHDLFGHGFDQGKSFTECKVLDGECVDFANLRVAGMGGIIGDPGKPGRVSEREFVRAMKTVLSQRPQVLVMHHGPDAERGELRGHSAIRRALDSYGQAPRHGLGAAASPRSARLADDSGELLVICGHVHWPTPTAVLRGGATVLNVDGRVVLLEEDRPARV